MIKAVSIGKTYGRSGEAETAALRHISLEIMPGEFICLMGPSGSGKTTLINLLGLLDVPTEGKLYWMGEELGQAPSHQRTQARRKHMAFVFQHANLIDDLTLYENIELPLIYQQVPAKERRERVMALMEQLQLLHKRQSFPSQVSGGQQQRVSVARAMASRPSLILADEPTGSLDSAQGQSVMELLQQLNNAGTTIVMATHAAQATDYCSRVIHLFDGQLVTENLRKAPTTDAFHLPNLR